jgi:uncharacterized protein YcbX
MSPRPPRRVVALWRYPVKSLQGERLERAEIDSLGIEHDRRWALLDRSTGLVLTCRREPRLLFAAARVDAAGGPPVITLDDGRTLTGDDELCAWLNRDVHLAEADPHGRGTYENPLDPEGETNWVRWQGPEGTFHDSTRTRVSIVGEDEVGSWDLCRFRPNVLVTGGHGGEFLGAEVRAGTARLTVGKAIDRCVVVTRPQPGGVGRDLGVLRIINRERGAVLGVGALVAGAGSIAVGDALADASVPG